MNLRFHAGTISTLAACLLGVLAGPTATADNTLATGTLHLDVGTVDTAALPNLLPDPPDAFASHETYVVQLNGPVTTERRATLQSLGLTLGDYLPRYAYIIRPVGATPAALANLEFVRWVGVYENDWKISPTIGHRLAPFETEERSALEAQGKYRLVATLFAGRDADSAAGSLANAGATVLGSDHHGSHNEIYIEVPQNLLKNLAALPDIQFVEEAPEITLRNNSNRWIVQSNTLNVTPFYDNGLHGEGQVVGVLDSRADQHHCSLDEGKILFYNSSDGNSTHGTHVSCTAVGDNGAFDDRRGVAYLGNMVFNTTPSFTESGILQRLNLHNSQGARIHTNSWGDDGTTNYNSLARGFDVFLYDNEDDFLCLAVTNLGNLRNPENAKNLVAVGASQDTPNQNAHCSGGVGPTADGRRKPEIYAPGCSTTSAIPSSCSTGNLTGTSMACPAVAGTAALIRQYYVDGYYPTGAANAVDGFTPTGVLIKATLLNSAVDMTGISGYPSNLEGWGRVLADDPAYFTGDARHLGVLDDVRNADGMSTGETLTYNVNVTDAAERLKITLVWNDPPASAGTGGGFAAVNDLNLEVVAPGGTQYLGNVFSGGSSVPGGLADDRNNVEQVHIDNPMLGGWTLRVTAAAVNQSTQGFALVATGAILLAPPDCNGNEIPDEDDIAAGTSLDCNSNGRPDECEEDCNSNGIADECEIAALITVQPESIDDCVGSAAVLSIDAPGASTFQWFKYDEPLTDGNGIGGATTHTLAIDALDDADSGPYRCEAASGCITAMSEDALLTVRPAPEISVPPTPLLDRCVGMPASFSVHVESDETVSFAWNLNGQPITGSGNLSGENTSKLLIDAAERADEGLYTCRVTGECGTTESTPGELRIVDPVFTTEPASTCVEAGGIASFTAQAQSPLDILYGWEWNGAPLMDGGDVSGASTDTLTITGVSAANAGQYLAYAITTPQPACVALSVSATLEIDNCAGDCLVPGDLDGDGDVDLADLQIFLGCFGPGGSQVAGCECASLVSEGDDVNVDDWAALAPLLTGPTTE